MNEGKLKFGIDITKKMIEECGLLVFAYHTMKMKLISLLIFIDIQ